MMYFFDAPKAKSTRDTRYFEMFSNPALYHDGWIAVCRYGRVPWENGGSYDFETRKSCRICSGPRRPSLTSC
jgi:hypothetical protein